LTSLQISEAGPTGRPRLWGRSAVRSGDAQSAAVLSWSAHDAAGQWPL